MYTHVYHGWHTQVRKGYLFFTKLNLPKYTVTFKNYSILFFLCSKAVPICGGFRVLHLLCYVMCAFWKKTRIHPTCIYKISWHVFWHIFSMSYMYLQNPMAYLFLHILVMSNMHLQKIIVCICWDFFVLHTSTKSHSTSILYTFLLCPTWIYKFYNISISTLCPTCVNKIS